MFLCLLDFLQVWLFQDPKVLVSLLFTSILLLTLQWGTDSIRQQPKSRTEMQQWCSYKASIVAFFRMSGDKHNLDQESIAKNAPNSYIQVSTQIFTIVVNERNRQWTSALICYLQQLVTVKMWGPSQNTPAAITYISTDLKSCWVKTLWHN